MVNYTYVTSEPLSHDFEITTLNTLHLIDTLKSFNSDYVVGSFNSTFNGTVVVKLSPEESIKSNFKLIVYIKYKHFSIVVFISSLAKCLSSVDKILIFI